MEPDRLKGSVSFETVVPTGPYRNIRIGFSQEFYLDEHTHEEILPGLVVRVRQALDEVATPKVREGAD